MANYLSYIIVLILLIVFIGLACYVLIIYSKLKTYKNEVDKLWNTLRLAIEEQFSFVRDNYSDINYKDKEYLNIVITNYFLLVSIEDIMKSYIELEKIMINIPDSQVKQKFLNKNKEIAAMKSTYNNVLLRYNNVVNMIPNKFVALIFKFNNGFYFPSK